jgi:large subunit ribosomal protein L29
MKFSELKKKSLEDLGKEATAIREEIWKLRFKQGINDLEDLHRIKMRKRDLARVLTALTQLKTQG